MSFSALGLSPALCMTLARLGYERPTPVQARSIPVVLAGHDLLARAQTGTGKTAAFALPLIDRLLVNRRVPKTPRAPRGLILVPTRELAHQVQHALSRYGEALGLRASAIYGGVAFGPQRLALQRGLDVVVGTPGRLLDHLETRTIDLGRVELLVLDEADRMLDMGFLPPLRRILVALPAERQTLLLSATLGDDVARLAREFTRAPVQVDVSERQPVATTVSHTLHPSPEGRKGELLAHVLRQAPADQALVFCKTKRGSDRVGEQLVRSGVSTAVIHGNKSQSARHRALGDFKARRARVLVATDIAARGLDIAELPLVVNYDLPLVAQDYIHRVGRTGRAGAPGRAISLVAASDRHLLADIERLLPSQVERVDVEGFLSGPELRPRGEAARGRAPGRPGESRSRSPVSTRRSTRRPVRHARPRGAEGR